MEFKHYGTDPYPAWQKSKTQWMKMMRRIKDGAAPVATATHPESGRVYNLYEKHQTEDSSGLSLEETEKYLESFFK